MPHLIDTPFVKRVLDDVRPNMDASLERVSEAVRATGEPPAPVQNPDEGTYEWRVARRLISLVSRFERLREAQRFVERTPARAFLKKLDVSQDAWIEYHYSQYPGALASVGDICLLLCEAVFAIGMPPRLCSKDAIRNNAWIKRTDVPKAIDEVEKVIREHRERRNLDLHRGVTADIAGVIGDRTFDTLRMVGIAARSTGDVETLRLVARGFRWMSAGLAKTMADEIDRLEVAVLSLLDLLGPEYDGRSPLSLRRVFERARAKPTPPDAA